MTSRFEAPSDDVLMGLPVEFFKHDEPWVTTVRAAAEDGSVVEFTWDHAAASVTARVFRTDEMILRIEREAIEIVRVYETGSGLHFEAMLSAAGIGGALGISVGSTVVVRDALLRQ